ncbi:N-acetylneuraminate synthase family protein [Planktomarina temperata]|nr:N-acetylneuraminate synthase family protein [Planktomarina temperata]MDB2459788.1 N-acetylneuraminate synthase family protein [Planktomarina temperata]
MKQPRLVAECCCNHMGDFKLALKMIDEVAKAGADYAKFQKWDPEYALSLDQFAANHPNPHHSFGEPYGEHRRNLEFSADQHRELKTYCSEQGVVYSCSVFDHISAAVISRINPGYIKIPSQKNLKSKIYDVVCKEYSGKIHLSTGMTDDDQVSRLLDVLDNYGALDRIVLYATTSSYPCAHENLYLLRISDYISRFSNKISSFGFSGHHNGIAADIAAITLGAEYVERHFTLDRTYKGTDHAASLEPQGLTKLKRDMTNVHYALKRRPSGILDVELEAYNKVKLDDAKVFEGSNL